MKRFDIGDEVLVLRAHGADRRPPFSPVKIFSLVYGGLYDYAILDAAGVPIYLCDSWLAPSSILISEDVDLTDLIDESYL